MDQRQALTERLFNLAGKPTSGRGAVLKHKERRGWLAGTGYLFTGYPERAYVFRDTEQASAIRDEFPEILGDYEAQER